MSHSDEESVIQQKSTQQSVIEEIKEGEDAK
jgi:hypothetical protein